jgi:hypothetical protein
MTDPSTLPSNPIPVPGSPPPVPGGTPTQAAPVIPGAPKLDPKTGSPPEGAAAEPKVSPKLQMLVRREKQALEREKSAKTKEEANTAREQALEAREAKIKEFETIKATNPRKALELLGMSYQELTMAELNDGVATPESQVKAVEAKFDSLKKSIEDKVKADAEAAKVDAEAQEKQAVANFQRELSGFIGENTKKYELINFEKQHGLVFAVIEEHYKRTIDEKTGIGKVMSNEEACDKVEAFLEKRYESALSLEKFKSRVVPARPAPKLPIQIPGQKPPTRTLTNQMSASQPIPKSRILTDQERVQKAVAYAMGLRTQK